MKEMKEELTIKFSFKSWERRWTEVILVAIDRQ